MVRILKTTYPTLVRAVGLPDDFLKPMTKVDYDAAVEKDRDRTIYFGPSLSYMKQRITDSSLLFSPQFSHKLISYTQGDFSAASISGAAYIAQGRLAPEWPKKDLAICYVDDSGVLCGVNFHIETSAELSLQPSTVPYVATVIRGITNALPDRQVIYLTPDPLVVCKWDHMPSKQERDKVFGNRDGIIIVGNQAFFFNSKTQTFSDDKMALLSGISDLELGTAYEITSPSHLVGLRNIFQQSFLTPITGEGVEHLAPPQIPTALSKHINCAKLNVLLQGLLVEDHLSTEQLERLCTIFTTRIDATKNKERFTDLYIVLARLEKFEPSTESEILWKVKLTREIVELLRDSQAENFFSDHNMAMIELMVSCYEKAIDRLPAIKQDPAILKTALIRQEEAFLRKVTLWHDVHNDQQLSQSFLRRNLGAIVLGTTTFCLALGGALLLSGILAPLGVPLIALGVSLPFLATSIGTALVGLLTIFATARIATREVRLLRYEHDLDSKVADGVMELLVEAKSTTQASSIGAKPSVPASPELTPMGEPTDGAAVKELSAAATPHDTTQQAEEEAEAALGL